jgi:hypothetical protein
MSTAHAINEILAGLWLGRHLRVRLPDLPPSGPLERGHIER